MLGTVIGDIVGSAYAFRNARGKQFQPLFHPDARHTRATVSTVGAADALLAGGDPGPVLQRWSRRSQSQVSWIPQCSQWAATDAPRLDASPSNAAAVRVSPAGLLARSIEDALGRALRVSAATHDHPEALRGALAVAAAIRWAREGLTAESIRDAITVHFAYDLAAGLDRIRAGYRRSDVSARSVPQAITCALAATSFEDALRNAVSIGGDSDALGAIAGGIAEARFGIPPDIAAAGWALLPGDMQAVLERLYRAADCPLPIGMRGREDEDDREAA